MVKKNDLVIKPLVSVVTSVFNDVNNIENAINSVKQQSYSNVEHIIIDAGSTDGTVDVIKKYSTTLSYWLSEPDSGIYDAWNKALKVAKGEWILFLGADDLLKPDGIKTMIDVVRRSPIQLEYVSGRTELLLNGKLLRITGGPWEWRKFRNYVCTGHIGAIHNRSLFLRYGEFDSNFRIVGDYEFLLRSGKLLKTGYTKNITASMNLGGVSNRNSSVIWETHRAKVKHKVNNHFIIIMQTFQAWIKWKLKKILHQL